jgi:hypothetical protein
MLSNSSSAVSIIDGESSGYCLYIHVMDGLGGDHHGTSIIGYKYQVLFEVLGVTDATNEDEFKDINDVSNYATNTTLNGTVVARTKPCTSRRHLFWDENIELVLPAGFVEANIGQGSIMIVSLCPVTTSPSHDVASATPLTWSCQLVLADLFTTLKRAGLKRSEMVLSMEAVVDSRDKPPPTTSPVKATVPPSSIVKPPLSSSSPSQGNVVRVRVGMLLIGPSDASHPDALTAVENFRHRDAAVAKSGIKRDESATHLSGIAGVHVLSVSPAIDVPVFEDGVADHQSMLRNPSGLNLKIPTPDISAPNKYSAGGKKPNPVASNMEVLLRSADLVDDILKDVDCTVQELTESVDQLDHILPLRGKADSLASTAINADETTTANSARVDNKLSSNTAEETVDMANKKLTRGSSFLDLQAHRHSTSPEVDSKIDHEIIVSANETFDKSCISMVKLAEHLRRKIREFLVALEPITAISKSLEIEEFTVVGVVKVKQSTEFDDQRRHVVDILHAVYGTVIGLKTSIRTVSDRLFERITGNNSRADVPMSPAGLLVTGDCYR